MFCPLFGTRKKDEKPPPVDEEDLEVPLLIPMSRDGVKIVGFTGKAGAGKDTAADYLVGNHGYEKHAFAGPLKRAVSVLFGIDLLTLNDPVMKEVPDRVWRKTPRYLLQWLGTDALRKDITDDFFIISMARAIDDDITFRYIGIRPGEKLHEIMISRDDSSLTIEFHDHFVICPAINTFHTVDFTKNPSGEMAVPVADGFEYSSNKNELFVDHVGLRRKLSEWL